MNKRFVWIVLAAALFGVAVWATPSVKPPAPITTAPKLHSVPDKPNVAEKKQMQARRTFSVEPANTGGAGVGAAPSKAALRDPFVYAIPPRTDTVVAEVTQLIDTRLGRVLQACYDVRALVAKTGLRLEDVDRLAIANIGKDDAVFVLGGSIARLAEIGMAAQAAPAPYGQYGQIFVPPVPPKAPDAKPADTSAKGGKGAKGSADLAQAISAAGYLAVWRGQVLMFSASRVQLERAIDRIEGRLAVPPFVADDQAYGAIYGEIATKATAKNFPGELHDLVSKLEGRLRFRASAPSDVTVEALTEGSDAVRAGKLAEQLRAQSRADAAKAGDKQGVELYDAINVSVRDSDVRVTVVVPFRELEALLGPCAKENPLAPPPTGGK